MPIPSDILSFIDDLTAEMIADIFESCSVEEIQQLMDELELRLWRSRHH
jgi:hypothetical protein